MGGKFWFFTDPASLGPQAPALAFGPQPPAGGNDQYQVTDLHSASTGAAPVIAICDGLLCAQKDADGTLSLILKPIEQPPFDFPAIAYFIYKGVDPASLLAGASVDVSKAGDNDLVKQVQATWLAPVNGNSGDPPLPCLGLHLAPGSSAADFPDLNLSLYADAEPLDHLFYRGDPKFQLPLVRGGWRLGDFTAAGPFGLEIVADAAAYSAPIKLARQLENRIEVPSLDPNLTYEPFEADFFMHWHAKEEALHFLDPCAFWGSFYDRKLRVVDASGTTTRKKGKAIYEDLLRGAHDDSAPTAGVFFNRNRIYLDIRNEHHRSFNYYKTNGDTILATLDADAAIETCAQPYYGRGWPVFTFDQTLLGADSSDTARLRLAFPGNEFFSLSLCMPPGNLARSASAAARQQKELDLSQGMSPEIELRFPLIGTGPRFTASRYVTLSVLFEGHLVLDAEDAAIGHYPWEPLPGIPLEGYDVILASATSTGLKTYSDSYVIRMPFSGTDPIVYNPVWIRGAAEAVLAITPAGPLTNEVGSKSPSHSAVLPSGRVIDAVNGLTRPRRVVAREGTGGIPFMDYSAPPGEAPVAKATAQQTMFFLSAAALETIQLAKDASVAVLNLVPIVRAEAETLALGLRGLRVQDGQMTVFSQSLDEMALSNVDPD